MKSSSILDENHVLICQLLKGSGEPPPTQLPPPQDNGEGMMINSSKTAQKKRCVMNLYGQSSTWLSSAVTSVTTSLAIKGVKDKDDPDKPTGRLIKIEGQTKVKEEGTELAAHATVPLRSECPTIDAF